MIFFLSLWASEGFWALQPVSCRSQKWSRKSGSEIRIKLHSSLSCGGSASLLDTSLNHEFDRRVLIRISRRAEKRAKSLLRVRSTRFLKNWIFLQQYFLDHLLYWQILNLRRLTDKLTTSTGYIDTSWGRSVSHAMVHVAHGSMATISNLAVSSQTNFQSCESTVNWWMSPQGTKLV